VRDAPWIALRTRDGCIYFANLLTRETRWLPPHLWMHGWVSRRVSRTGTCTASDLCRSHMSRVLDSGGRDLPCDGRKPLPPSVAFQRVEGGAPYMYEPTHGTPQYPPDKSWDSQLTYPLEGSYTPMPYICPCHACRRHCLCRRPRRRRRRLNRLHRRMHVLEPSPVVALAREVYASVRLRGRDYGVDSLCRARQPPTPFSGKILMERRNTCARLA
jgi:hypothetical protein